MGWRSRARSAFSSCTGAADVRPKIVHRISAVHKLAAEVSFPNMTGLCGVAKVIQIRGSLDFLINRDD